MTATRLGPFRLGEVRWARGFTVTYRAEHDALGRPVLVKTLKPAVSITSPFADELAREAKILARLQHENIAAMLEAHRSPEAVWLSFEDPGGFRLSEVLAKVPRLPVDVATAIALDVARGLAHAHARGVVHGDLRPDNVELTKEGGLKLWGFRAAAGEPSGAEPLETSEAFGTPDYMAPEQVLGDPPGPASDVFALGGLLYEMLAGARPFDAKDKREVSRRIRAAAPPPLPEGVPKGLERIVLRCLAKRADERFEDAPELVASLEDALAERTRATPALLVARALWLAKLGPEPRTTRAAALPPVASEAVWAMPALRRNALLLLLIVAGGAAIRLVARGDDDAEPAAAARWAPGAEADGYLRVLATPWAEIVIDGELVDTTPVGRPIPVAAGRHYITFRHPNAPDEKRTIQIASGQTVLLDVTMRVERSEAPDAGAGAGDAGGDLSP